MSLKTPLNSQLVWPERFSYYLFFKFASKGFQYIITWTARANADDADDNTDDDDDDECNDDFNAYDVDDGADSEWW